MQDSSTSFWGDALYAVIMLGTNVAYYFLDNLPSFIFLCHCFFFFGFFFVLLLLKLFTQINHFRGFFFYTYEQAISPFKTLFGDGGGLIKNKLKYMPSTYISAHAT